MFSIYTGRGELLTEVDGVKYYFSKKSNMRDVPPRAYDEIKLSRHVEAEYIRPASEQEVKDYKLNIKALSDAKKKMEKKENKAALDILLARSKSSVLSIDLHDLIAYLKWVVSEEEKEVSEQDVTDQEESDKKENSGDEKENVPSEGTKAEEETDLDIRVIEIKNLIISNEIDAAVKKIDEARLVYPESHRLIQLLEYIAELNKEENSDEQNEQSETKASDGAESSR